MEFVVSLPCDSKNTGESSRNTLIEKCDGSSIKLAGQEDDLIFNFDRIYDGHENKAEIIDKINHDKLKSLISGEDSLLITAGLFDKKKEFLQRAVERALEFSFKNIKSEKIASFKAMSKALGTSLINSNENGEQRIGTIGLTISIFEAEDDSVRDLITNKILPQAGSASYARDIKDGKIKPMGLTQSYLSSYDQSREVVSAAFKRKRKANKKLLVDLVIQINCYEIKRFHRLQSTRFMIASFSHTQEKIKAPSKTDLESTELAKLLEIVRAGHLPSSLFRNSRIAKLLFADIKNSKKFNATVWAVLDSKSVEEAKETLSLLYPCVKKKKATPGAPFTTLNQLSEQLEQLKLELIETRNKNVMLASENKLLTEKMISIEQITRLEMSNQYEMLIDDMARGHAKVQLQEDESKQLASDVKLECLSQHYEAKIAKVKGEAKNLKLQAENLKYQNSRLDEIFHVEVSKITDNIQKEFEAKFKDEIQHAANNERELSETNEMLNQKVQLLESQINVLKEKCDGRMEEAEQLYSKIKSLGLEDDVLQMINDKFKSQLSKSKKTVTVKPSPVKRKSSSPLVSLSQESNEFTIYEDGTGSTLRDNKRRLVRKSRLFEEVPSDIEAA